MPKDKDSFSREDIPVARYVLQEAWEFVLEAEANQKTDLMIRWRCELNQRELEV